MNVEIEAIWAPGFSLLSPETAIAGLFLSKLCRKWIRPLGNANDSPALSCWVYNLLDVSTKPTRISPLRQVVTSEARGCEWGGTSPSGAMSIRAMLRPWVRWPGRFWFVVRMTLNPNWLVLVLPGLDRAEVAKWYGVARLGSLHGGPLNVYGLDGSTMQ